MKVYRTVWAIVALLLVATAIYGAAAIGYQVGGIQVPYKFAPADASYTIGVLRLLRDGNYEAATSLLEGELDSHILEHSLYDVDLARWLDRTPILFWWYDLEDDPNVSVELMRRVGECRRSHSSTSNTPEVRKMIESHLAQFD